MSGTKAKTKQKKTQAMDEWVNRNLQKGPPVDPLKFGLALKFGELLHDKPYAEFPSPLRAKLRAPVEKAIDRGDERTANTEIGTFKSEVQRVAGLRTSWQNAANRVQALDDRIKRLPGLGVPSAAEPGKKLDALKKEAEEQGEYQAALDHLTELERDVLAAIENQYKQRRKALEAREQQAAGIPDVPPYLKTLKDTYLSSVAATKVHVDNGDYEAAIGSLAKLDGDLAKALAGQKRATTEGETKTKCDGVKSALNKEIDWNGGKVKVRQAVGSQEWKEAYDEILKTKLDGEFLDRYNKGCEKVADDIANNPIIKNAAKNWDTWFNDYANNETKIKEAMQEILKTQSEALGWPTPTAQPYKADDGDCGSYSGTGYPPGTLKVNFHYDDAKDFKELIDTLTHENTHAYQEKLIRDFRAGTLKPGDDNYNAAMILEMNDTGGDTRGYISDDNSDAYKKYCKDNGVQRTAKNAYKEQACEMHAWGAGGLISKRAWDQLKPTT